MHDVVLIEDSESLNYLGVIGESTFLREGSSLLQEFLQSSTVTVLVDEVEIVDGFEHIEVLDDVRTRLEVGEYADLIVGAFF